MIPTTHRRSFTLVELLATITIFAILLGVVLAGVAGAERFAREAHTKDLIVRLNQVVMTKWNNYLTRRVPVNLANATGPGAAAELRLNALHELMRMEMPERFTDITANRTYLSSDPPLLGVYRGKIGNSTTALNQPAKCLYLIVNFGTDDDDDASLFSEADVKDVDGDGLRVFVDAWGNPIQFLRWAPAFVSELQPNPPVSPYQFDPAGVLAKRRNSTDPLAAYALYPLIYSAGRDGILDVTSGSPDYSKIKNDPFDDSVRTVVGRAPIQDPPPAATRTDDASADNIHSHAIVMD